MSVSWRGYTRNPDGTLTRVIEVHEPGHAVLYRGSIHGSMVTGAPGPNDRAVHRAEAARSRLTANQAKLDDRPIVNGRPRLSPDVQRSGRGVAYASEEERTAGRRQSWRESSRRARQRSSAA